VDKALVTAAQSALRANGPLETGMLILVLSEQGVTVTAEQLDRMAEQNDLTALEFLLADGAGIGRIYFHPRCSFRVLNFR
jgi:hypothetical protein